MNKLFATLTAIATLVALLAGAAAWADEPESEAFSRERLHQLLAPIALYPDTVLTHVLIAATYPIEVVQADRWARQHTQLQGQQAVNAADQEDWDPSVRSLVAFPDLLSRMSEDLLWTQEVGEAFLADEEATLDAIQELRAMAWEEGTLKEMEHMEVVREKQYISIQPVRREVVYVPYYNPAVVYGRWHWTDYPPYYWSRPISYQGTFYWGYSAPVGDWFYSSGFHWPRRTVVISVNRPYYYHSHRQYGYHEGARFWRHNPHHRRGAHYRHVEVRRQWATPAQQTIPNRHYSTRDRQRELNQRLQQRQELINNPRQHNVRTEALRNTSGERSAPSERNSATESRLERLHNRQDAQPLERSQEQNNRRDELRNNIQRTPTNTPPAATPNTQRSAPERRSDTSSRLQRQDTPSVRQMPRQEMNRSMPRQQRAPAPRAEQRSSGTRSAPRRER